MPGELKIRGEGNGCVVTLDDVDLLSASMVEVLVIGGGWIPGVLTWNRHEAAPALRFRILLAAGAGAGASSIEIEFEVPPNAMFRRLRSIDSAAGSSSAPVSTPPVKP